MIGDSEKFVLPRLSSWAAAGLVRELLRKIAILLHDGVFLVDSNCPGHLFYMHLKYLLTYTRTSVQYALSLFLVSSWLADAAWYISGHEPGRYSHEERLEKAATGWLSRQNLTSSADGPDEPCCVGLRFSRHFRTHVQSDYETSSPRVVLFRASRAELLVLCYGCDPGLLFSKGREEMLPNT